MVGLLAQLNQLGSLFAGVVGNGPLSAILVALGAIFVFGSILFVAYLGVGAFLSLFIPARSGQTHRPGA